MGGIAGWVGARPAEDGRSVATAMSAALHHRGPDGHGELPLADPRGSSGWMSHAGYGSST